MTYFDVDELQLIVKRGDGKYEFCTENRFYLISIIKRINDTDANNIEDFLDCQFDDNQFRYLFAAIVYYYANGSHWIKDRKSKEILRNWVENTFPLSLEMIGAIFAILFDKKEEDKNLRINTLTANMDMYEIVEVLSFYVKISEEEMMLHRKRYRITY